MPPLLNTGIPHAQRLLQQPIWEGFRTAAHDTAPVTTNNTSLRRDTTRFWASLTSAVRPFPKFPNKNQLLPSGLQQQELDNKGSLTLMVSYEPSYQVSLGSLLKTLIPLISCYSMAKAKLWAGQKSNVNRLRATYSGVLVIWIIWLHVQALRPEMFRHTSLSCMRIFRMSPHNPVSRIFIRASIRLRKSSIRWQAGKLFEWMFVPREMFMKVLVPFPDLHFSPSETFHSGGGGRFPFESGDVNAFGSRETWDIHPLLPALRWNRLHFSARHPQRP